MCLLSPLVLSDSVTPCTVAGQAPLSMEFSRQVYWRELPGPTVEDLPDPEIESMSLASPALAGRFFTTEPPGKPHDGISHRLMIMLITMLITRDYMLLLFSCSVVSDSLDPMDCSTAGFPVLCQLQEVAQTQVH